MQIIQSIQNKIYEIRGERMMLDFDLADLYEVPTKVLNQAVKRNIMRFPDDFMIRLSIAEWQYLQSQISISVVDPMSLRSQFVTLKTGRGAHRKFLPYAFTEQGVAMLSSVLHSDKAIKMNIAIMRTFVEVRKALLQQFDLKIQLKEIRERIGEHDVQLNEIYDVMENLLDEKAAQSKWDDRQKIGYKK